MLTARPLTKLFPIVALKIPPGTFWTESLSPPLLTMTMACHLPSSSFLLCIQNLNFFYFLLLDQYQQDLCKAKSKTIISFLQLNGILNSLEAVCCHLSFGVHHKHGQTSAQLSNRKFSIF